MECPRCGNDYAVVRCANCKQVWTDTSIDPAELLKLVGELFEVDEGELPSRYGEGIVELIEDAAVNLLNAIQADTIRPAILLRKFSHTFRPDPKRYEWQGSADCLGCPYLTRYFGSLACRLRIPFLDVNRMGAGEWPDYGDPSFCRFSEYRKVLFMRFGKVT